MGALPALPGANRSADRSILTTPDRVRFGGASAFLLALLLFATLSFLTSRAFAQDEFLLNDDRIDRDQWSPRVARGPTGTLVVTWMDGRNGTASFVDFDAYAMTIRNPAAIGSSVNRRLNDDAPGAIQGYPAIAASPANTFLCAWEDGRAGNRDIYAATLDSVGIRVTPNLRVNDDAGAADQANPQVAAVGDSRYLVVWGDARQGQGEVFGSFRTTSGAAIGGNVRFSVDPVSAGSYQGEPAAAANAAGLTLVVWRDGREGGTVFGATFDVYGQWLDADGQALGGNFKVNDTIVAQNDGSLCVAADSTLGFVVGWIDRRAGPSDPGDVYAQRYDASRAAVGGNVRVNDDVPGRDQRVVRAFAGPGAAFLIWEDLRDNLGLDSNVEAARVPFDASPPGANFRINVLTPSRQGSPAAAWDGRDAILAVWEDTRNGGQKPADIYAVSCGTDGTPHGTESQLNDDAAANDQRRPRIGRGPGQYVAAWTDLRGGGGNNLYCQSISAAGARDGPNYRLWLDDAVNRPMAEAAAVSPSGPALVVAQLTRDSDAGEIRGFLMPTPGAGPASSFWITDSLPSAQAMPAIAATAAEFAVVWLDGRDGAIRIYGQRLGLDGTRLGVNHAVLAQDPADPVYDLDLDVDPAGGYWLFYAEGIGVDQRLWLAHLDGSLSSDASPSAIEPLLTGSRSRPRLGVGPDGRVEMVWLGTSAAGYGQVYYKSLDASGAALGPVLALGAPTVTGPEESPSISVAGSRSIVSWAGKQDGDWSIWLQGFDNGVSPFTGVLRVDQDVLGADQIDPSCGLDISGRAVVIWSDGRSPSSRTDILGRTLSFAPTAVLEPPDPWPTPEPPPPSPPRLFRAVALPNPFSSSLGLALDVPESAARRVTVRVVNVRGEVVATLHDGPATPGSNFIRWNALGRGPHEVASGVYWILVEGGNERHALRVVHLR
jgi:hypothetical protein